MRVYLVGGAVRDGLLGLPIKDKDFVVVGADAKALLAQGFRQVGADFPVFLHPKTGAEYALARTERKKGAGHRGFFVDTKRVSLKEDLLRRDFCINAMAIEVGGLFDEAPKNGEIIDYYGGLLDVRRKTLRHVSAAFCEDPLRVLRGARFLAYLAPFGFVLDDATKAAMRAISESGDLASLSRERIWNESAKGLMAAADVYVACLRNVGALATVTPLVAKALSDDAAFLRVQSRLVAACAKNLPLAGRVAVWLSLSDAQSALQTLSDLKAPKAILRFVAAFFETRGDLRRFAQAPCPRLALRLIERTKAHKDSGALFAIADALDVCDADFCAQTCKKRLVEAIDLYNAPNVSDVDPSLKGKAIGEALTSARLKKLALLNDDKRQAPNTERL